MEPMDLLDNSDNTWQSSHTQSSKSLLVTPGVEYERSTATVTEAAYVSERLYQILFLDAEDNPAKWEFLTTKAPLPVFKLLANPTVTEILLTTEPGPKVDYEGLGNTLALLKPFVISSPSGPALLRFFKSLLDLRVRWLLAVAELEAFRCYDKTTFTYYIGWNEAFQQDTAGRALDDNELAYWNECQDHLYLRLSQVFELQEEQLVKEAEVEAMKLTNFKTSGAMWKNSRILWTVTEQYQHYQQTKTAIEKHT